MSITNYERETIVNFNEEERTSSVYTHNKRIIKRLEESCKKFPDLFRLESRVGEACTFIIPKKYISIRQPKIMSDEQKQKASERMKHYKGNLTHLNVDNNTNLVEEKAG